MIAAGAYHTLICTKTGSVLGVGGNQDGQLGDGTTTTRLHPSLVLKRGIREIAAGRFHSLAVTETGELLVWGQNKDGLNVYTGMPGKQTTPVRLMESGVRSVAAGWAHNMVGTDESWNMGAGRVLTWGDNVYGQLGDGQLGDGLARRRTLEERQRPSSVIVSGPLADPPVELEDISTVAAGWYHSMALGKRGELYTWGFNMSGQLGDGSWQSKCQPVLVWDGGFQKIAAGSAHSLGLTTDGEVYAWGGNNFYQVGDSTNIKRGKPVRVVSSGAVEVLAGESFSLAVTRAGDVFTWGSNNLGQIGDSTAQTRPTPVMVLSGASMLPLMVAVGDAHSMVAVMGDKVMAWGANQHGQLGDGSRVVKRITPAHVLRPEDQKKAQSDQLALLSFTSHIKFIEDGGHHVPKWQNAPGPVVHLKGFASALSYEDPVTQSMAALLKAAVENLKPGYIVWDGNDYGDDSFTRIIMDLYKTTKAQLVVFLRREYSEHFEKVWDVHASRAGTTILVCQVKDSVDWRDIGRHALHRTRALDVICLGGAGILEDEYRAAPQGTTFRLFPVSRPRPPEPGSGASAGQERSCLEYVDLHHATLDVDWCTFVADDDKYQAMWTTVCQRTVHVKGYSSRLDFSDPETAAAASRLTEHMVRLSPTHIVWDGALFSEDSFSKLILPLQRATNATLVAFVKRNNLSDFEACWEDLGRENHIAILAYTTSDAATAVEHGIHALRRTSGKNVLCLGNDAAIEEEYMNSALGVSWFVFPAVQNLGRATQRPSLERANLIVM